MSDLYRPQDIAGRIGVSTSRIYQLLREPIGTPIPHLRRGRAIVIPAAAFEDWLRSQNEAAEAAVAGRE